MIWMAQVQCQMDWPAAAVLVVLGAIIVFIFTLLSKRLAFAESINWGAVFAWTVMQSLGIGLFLFGLFYFLSIKPVLVSCAGVVQ